MPVLSKIAKAEYSFHGEDGTFINKGKKRLYLSDGATSKENGNGKDVIRRIKELEAAGLNIDDIILSLINEKNHSATLVIAEYISSNRWRILNLGDSRAYLISLDKKTQEQKIEQLTRDNTIYEQIHSDIKKNFPDKEIRDLSTQEIIKKLSINIIKIPKTETGQIYEPNRKLRDLINNLMKAFPFKKKELFNKKNMIWIAKKIVGAKGRERQAQLTNTWTREKNKIGFSPSLLKELLIRSQHILTASLNSGNELAKHVIMDGPVPYTGTPKNNLFITIKPGSILMLCSDGLTDNIIDDQIILRTILKYGGNIRKSIKELITIARNNGLKKDDISIILMRAGWIKNLSLSSWIQKLCF